ncbi:MAG: type I 3-dehydroquinate dehydratase [Phycisphaerales bacterium]|nr:type I 3-dehydroquinate dehydratase [Phycisphaerales bacterium]
MTLLCVPIMVHDIDAALADAAAAKSLGADIVEFRIDEFFDGGHSEADPGRQTREILRLVHQSVLPAIVTCRSASEGGGYDGDETDRVSLYERLGTAEGKNETPPRYLDIELAAYTRSENIKQKVNLAVEHSEQQRAVSTGLILSMHDFQQRPSDLSRRLLLARQQPAAKVTKLAFRARSLRDNLELFEILTQRDRPTIALGMGEFGLMSRVLAPKFGGFLTFASLRPTATTAPGQPTVSELLDLYRFRSIKPTTKVYGVIGWPVGHSLSPLVHNAVFGSTGFDGVYLPLPIPSADAENNELSESARAEATYTNFKATLGALIDDPRLDFSGASVTLPHKENLVRFALERFKSEAGVWSLDAVSLLTGSANSLVIEREASGEGSRVVRARVFNTDVPAAVGPLREALGTLEGKHVAVVGAGGVARGIAFGLAVAGARVTIFNRNRAKAETLALELSEALKKAGAGPGRPRPLSSPASRGGGAFQAPAVLGRGAIDAATMEQLSSFRGDAFVQCTPVGMKGGPDPEGCPISVGALAESGNCGAGTVVLETVYNPRETPLVREAKRVGWRVIEGATMFVRQAAEQSGAWTGNDAPIELIERLVNEPRA